MNKYLKNAKGEEINTKEMAIKALVHTANYEQMSLQEIWCFNEQCEIFGIDKTKFYVQDMCKECMKWGVLIYHYKDDDFEYRYDNKCPACGNKKVKKEINK